MDITVDQSADRAVLVLHGSFDVRSTSQVRHAIYEQINDRDEDLVVDMTEVEGIDVTALRLLAFATRQAHKSGHQLTLRGCGPAVRRMLHLSRLAHAVEVERAAATA